MTKSLIIILLLAMQVFAYAAQLETVRPIATRSDKSIILILDFDAAIKGTPDASKYSLVSPSGEVIPVGQVVAANKTLRIVVKVNSASFAVIERMVNEASGYLIHNEEPLEFEDGSVAQGGLDDMTKGKIPNIDQENWKKYILDEYSSQYLFPQKIAFGTSLGLEDSSKTVYNLELVHSENYVRGEEWFVFWGFRGRWSTWSEDKLNYAQFYPVVLFHNSSPFRTALSMGVETGYLGFAKDGRGAVKAECQFRLPYNPIDLTFGSPRWRINPVINISLQGNVGWSNVELPDSMKRYGEVTGRVRYDIPVGEKYYLQSSASGTYTSLLKQVDYSYDVSFGYIADGTIRVAAEYKQGNQLQTYVFDKQLLLSFALDVLNSSSVK